MFQTVLLFLVIYLGRFECFKFRKSGELQHGTQASQVRSFLETPTHSGRTGLRVGMGYDIHRVYSSTNLDNFQDLSSNFDFFSPPSNNNNNNNIQSMNNNNNIESMNINKDKNENMNINDVKKRKVLRLGGVWIPEARLEVEANSDGDVVLHSLSDAILGALGKGDIGDFFPESDPQFENYDSVKILKKVLDLAWEMNFSLVNVDVCIILQEPKLGPLKNKIKENLNLLLGYNTLVNVKAKTNEKLDSLGNCLAISCNTIILLQYLY